MTDVWDWPVGTPWWQTVPIQDPAAEPKDYEQTSDEPADGEEQQ
ncbi:hypothetical protein [Streptomyces sp. YIM 98790]|nr:hypothetical protein [Streptomyces sp. YIM 98790]